MQQLSLRLDADPILPRIHALLLTVYGAQRDAQRLDPTTQFVYAMISSLTYDAVSWKAFLQLHRFLRSWNALPDTATDRIAAVISDVTHATRKADHLVRASRIIRALRDRFDLAFLADWPLENAFDWLIRLPGVGPKVAAATLNFSSLCKRALVVDTHGLRVSRRLGLLPNNADFVCGFHGLMRFVPDNWDSDDLYELHWLMKMHGQTICRHQRPACGKCPLAQFCAKAQLQHPANQLLI
jgi:endonuclease-3